MQALLVPALWLPESIALSTATHRHNPVAALFRDGLAPSTALLRVINLLKLFNNYFILLWMPAILRLRRSSAQRRMGWVSSWAPCLQRRWWIASGSSGC
jgi:hypothetical protein